MATGDRIDPYRGYAFKLEIDGIQRAGFSEVTGLDSTQAPVDYREGNEKALTARKLPALNTYSNISLKWGSSQDTDLMEWRQKTADGELERKNGSVILCDDKGEEVVRWNFFEAWPTKWVGPTFSATSNEVAIESMELVHERVVRA